MGHVRLGVLPATRNWQRVVELLGDSSIEVDQIAIGTANAAARLFGRGDKPGILVQEPGLVSSFWVLTQVVFLASKDNYFDRLTGVGIPVDVHTIDSCISFIDDVTRAAEETTDKSADQSAFSEIAVLSLKETLARALTNQTRTLFGTTGEDIRNACRRYATVKQFGELSRDFFGTFLYRTLNFLISKAIHDHTGPGRRFARFDDLSTFEGALLTYCRERAGIVESFSGGWTTKEQYEQGRISTDAVQRFMAYAVKKIGKELDVHGVVLPQEEAL